MTIALTNEQLSVYHKALEGHRSLFGWGFRESYFFERWQEQYPIKDIIEANWRFWDKTIGSYHIHNPYILKEFDPATHVVASSYRGPWVEEYAKRIAGMPTVPALPLQHIMRLIQTGGTLPKLRVSPLSVDQIQELCRKLGPYLEHYGPYLSTSPGLGVPEKFADNLHLLGSYDWPSCVASVASRIPPMQDTSNTVVMVGNSLTSGGAERQMINLCLGFQDAGWNVHSLSVVRDQNAAHYVEALRSRKIPIHHATEGVTGITEKPFMESFLSSLSPDLRLAMWHLPHDLILLVASTIIFFNKVKPRLVVAYLDWPSCVAGLAGILTGVPHIVLSGRNYPPPCFPQFFDQATDFLRNTYRILSDNPRVRLTNNSNVGGEAYAKWLGLSKKNIAFIPNCLTAEFMRDPSPSAVSSLRKRFGLTPKNKVILGIFRLSEEKRPEKFVNIVSKLVAKDPHIRAIICGGGLLKDKIDKLIVKKKLEKHIFLTGVVSEVREMMQLADILLHTAVFEGMPNVMLEAQAQGLPIVCTRSGGVVDCLAPELLPYSFSKNDWPNVEKAARKLLNTPKLRTKLSKSIKKHARKEYTLKNLVRRTIAASGITKGMP